MLPDVSITVQDGALGQVPPSTAGAQFKTGVCSLGIVGTMYTLSTIAAARAALGVGPLVEAVCQTLAVGGGPVYAMPINPSTYGSAGAVTHTGPGVGTVAVSLAPAQSVAIKIFLGGVLGTATFQVSLGGGAYGAITATAAGPGSYAIPGTMTTVTLAAGTYVAGDIYTISTLGVVTLVGSGPAATNVTFSSSPLDLYAVVVTVVAGGALGTATFNLSVDGGNNTGGQISTPGAGKYAIPGTGVVLTFASTFTAADTYAFTTTAAGFNGTDVNNAYTAALGNAARWGFSHLVGAASSAAGAATIAATVDTLMTTAQVAYRFVWTVTECPITESDSTLTAAFASFQSARVAVCACDVGLISAIDAKIERRNLAWVFTAHCSIISPGEDPAFVGSVALVKNVVSIYPNGTSTVWDPTTLDANRFITMRVFPDRPGYYITNGWTMAAYGSDYSAVVHRRVMDIACGATRRALLPYLNGSVRVNTKNGFINELDAQNIEAEANAEVRASVKGMISTTPDGKPGASVVLDRATNLFNTTTEPVSVRLVPLAYLRGIAATMGFSNPALSA